MFNRPKEDKVDFQIRKFEDLRPSGPSGGSKVVPLFQRIHLPPGPEVVV